MSVTQELAAQERCVLIVDNDARTRSALVRHLSSADIRCVTAEHGEQALALARSQRLGAVALDVMLPGMDGFEVLRALREDPRTASLPVMLMKGVDDRSIRERAWAAGADDFIAKPPELGEFLARVRNLLRLAQLHEACESRRAELERDLTGRDQALATLLDAAPIYLLQLDRDLVIRFANRSSRAQGPLLGRTLDALGSPPEVMADLRAKLRSVLDTGQTLSFEAPGLAPGSSAIYATRMAPYHSGTDVAGVIIAAIDVTTRKAAETALREADSRFRTVLERINSGALMLDPDGQVSFCNDYLAGLLGYPRDQIIGKNWFCAFHPPDVEVTASQAWARIKREGEPVHLENEVLTQSGKRLLLRWTNTVLRDADGNVTGVVSLAEDITAQRAAERDVENRSRNLSVNHAAARLLQDRARPAGDLLREVASLLAASVRHPELAEACVCVRTIRARTARFHECPHTMGATFPLADGVRGSVRVGYREKPADADAAEPFGADEHRALDSLADTLSLFMDRVEAEAAATATRLSLEEAQQLAHVGNWDWEIPGGGITWSDEVFRIFGDAPQAYTPTYAGFLQRVHVEERPAVEAAVNAALRGEPYDMVHRIVLPNGLQRTVRERGALARDAGGRPVRMLGTVQDITESQRSADALRDLNATLERRVAERTTSLKEANRELEALVEERQRAEAALRASRDDLSAANAALARASRMKDEFLASMSHELRTPLAGVLGLAEALQSEVYGALAPAQARAVRTIEEGGSHLLSLINDILDLSKVESGQVELELTRCSIMEVVHGATAVIRRMVEAKNQAVQVSVEPNDLVVRTDPRRLKQVLINLLGNAVKFTPTGGELGLDVTADATAGVLRLAVWDRGIGIAAEDLPRLFQPFTQLDSGLARRYEGTGLGLSLVMRMTRLLGGSVTVDSTPDRGSRFTVTLPWQPQPADPSQAGKGLPEPLPVASAAARLVLLVEDNEVALNLMRDYLQSRGLRVAGARGGREALAQVQELHPDVVLMDIQMPDMDGLEAIRELRRHPETRALPVVAVTALAMPGDRERCMAAGATDYLSKPVNLAALLGTVQALTGSPA
ncbi:MAG: response regulator [Deltaproteobacteria bacterium]|nr:response regulator [Deltaproteobacteria bacterium]